MTGLWFSDVHGPDETALRAWFDLRVAVTAVDRPGDPRLSWSWHAGNVRQPWPGMEVHSFLAHDDDTLVGWCSLMPSLTENRDTAPVELSVHPRHRRRGLGREMLREAGRRAAELDRTRLVAEASAGGPGAAFAAAVGARPALADTQRRLDLRTVDESLHSALFDDAAAHAGGYSLLRWTGATPEEHVDQIAELTSRMTTDAPMDDLVWEQEVFDDARIRARDQVRAARRMRCYTTAARHDATGRIVGFTCLVVDDGRDEHASQWETIVLPDHRGHRLGLLLKIANLRHLRDHEPAVTTIDTWNTDSNGPMLRVNLALGFDVVRQWAEWELVG